jgi:hypothetical protein
MVLKTSHSLIEALRSALEQLERTEEISSDDPALRELKRSILLMIAELESKKSAVA